MPFRLEELNGRVNLSTRAVGNTPTGGFYDASKPRVPRSVLMVVLEKLRSLITSYLIWSNISMPLKLMLRKPRLEEELTLQFFPESVEYNARRALRDL
ncbi:hypothetical protein Vadar_022786 [Vaccinium darrowii]|uniref:Uncharacterized protein n=1 Tax=Vaccinium darrowii TaxID=229202 RepID=A0ACB7YFJ1_9ERIC|nr:hypothetical protein Vadar_022786 [Vaccinium darrowii]